MNNYYFTYGIEGQPFYGGWTLIRAENEMQARAMFRVVHHDRIPGVLNCAGVYGEEFTQTRAYQTGNFGAGCHEVISIQRRATV